MKITDKVNKICYELEDHHERLQLVESITTDHELYQLLEHYNWDDGYEIPTIIANHPECDLTIAQCLYWLADANHWIDNEEAFNDSNKANFEFSKLISPRLLGGYYKVGQLSHSENFNRVQIYHFKKQNLPEVLYLPVIGQIELGKES